jgi:hypothetical protein
MGRRFAAAAIVLLFVAPRAGAEEGPTRLRIDPSIRFTTVLDDNLFLEDSDRKNSIGVWIAPRVEVGYRMPALEVGADVGVDFRRYAGYFNSAGDELVHASGFGEVGLLPGLTLRLSDAYPPTCRSPNGSDCPKTRGGT